MAKTPFVPAANTVTVEMIYNEGFQICENVYHVLLSGAPSLGNMTAVMNEFIAWEVNTARAKRSNSLIFQKIVVRDASQQNGLVIEGGPATTTNGQNTSLPQPMNVTVAIKHVTGLSGRSFRGRSYWVGLCLNDVVASNLTDATLTQLKAIMTTLMQNLTTNTNSHLACVSKRHDNAWRTQAVVTPIIGFTIDPVVDSQRRRLPERGR